MILDHMVIPEASLFNIDEVLIAKKNLKPWIRETPLDYSLVLSHSTGCCVYLKCEHLQYTGSFKIRGALNKLMALTSEQRSQGVVTASCGNHGAAVAYGLSKLHIPGIIFLPENAPLMIIENIRHFGIPIEFCEKDAAITESYAIDYARRHKMPYIAPYNDMGVIHGHATIAEELIQQLNPIDVVFVPVGGGGLVSGIAAFLKKMAPHIKVIGCLPENSPTMSESIKAGQIIKTPIHPTLSDATHGAIFSKAITFKMCQDHVDEYVLVRESEIEKAIIQLIQTHHFLIEGAAGVALAAFLKVAERFQEKNVVIVLSGANISLEMLKVVLA